MKNGAGCEAPRRYPFGSAYAGRADRGSRIARLALGRDHTRGENNVEVNCLRTCPTGGGACETEPAPFCLIACRVLDVPVPEIVLQRAGIAPMVEELIP